LTSKVLKTEIFNKGKENKEVLLDSKATELVMSLEFTKKNKFKKKKLESIRITRWKNRTLQKILSLLLKKY